MKQSLPLEKEKLRSLGPDKLAAGEGQNCLEIFCFAAI